MKKLNYLIGIPLALTFMTACNSGPKVTELGATSDPQVELDRVDSGIKKALNNQVDILAPENFSNAKRARDKAVAARADGKSQSKILHSISVSQAYLDSANGVAAVANQILPGAIDARKDALLARSDVFFHKELESLDDDLRKYTTRIEKNDTKVPEEKRLALEASYRDIEMQSIKVARLGEARKTLKMATDEGARKLTPETLAWAEARVLAAESVIEKNRHNSDELDKASADATASANRLIKMVRDAKGSTEMRPEDFAKKVEAQELAVAQAEKSRGQTSADLARSRERLANETARNAKLESQVSLDREFELARSQFTKEEAEVYKQGNTLLLRLKGLSFASNQAVIDSNNFALLAKVQQVIRDVGASKVVVEGHTDSVGGKELNEELSTRRADSILAYMVSNQNVAPEKISAIGYGDTKPIASNKTAVGRAQNRRVDVIISAESELK